MSRWEDARQASSRVGSINLDVEVDVEVVGAGDEKEDEDPSTRGRFKGGGLDVDFRRAVWSWRGAGGEAEGVMRANGGFGSSALAEGTLVVSSILPLTVGGKSYSGRFASG